MAERAEKREKDQERPASNRGHQEKRRVPAKPNICLPRSKSTRENRCTGDGEPGRLLTRITQSGCAAPLMPRDLMSPEDWIALSEARRSWRTSSLFSIDC